jgi:hypothetical protein
MSENLMAAYLERSLTSAEMSAVESHVAGCTSCQEVLALALKLQSENATVPLQALSTPSKKRLFHFSIPIPAIGALLVCIALGALFFRWPHQAPVSDKLEQVAELRAPVEPTAQPPAPVTAGPDVLKKARVGAPVDKMDLREAQTEDKATASPGTQSALLYRSDELDSIEGNSKEKTLSKKEEDHAGSVLAGSSAALPFQAASEIPPGRGEKDAGPRSVPALLPMAAVPAGAVSGKGNNLPPTEAESARPIVADQTASLLSQSVDAPLNGRGEAATVPPTVPAAPKPAALQAGGASGGEKGLPAKEELGKPESSTSDQSAEAIVLARTQQPFVRPPLYAASNRIATSLYQTESVESSLQFAIKNLSANRKTAKSKKIGDRVFYKHMGFSIDGHCIEHAENPIVSVTADDPEYKTILEKYPEIISILPAAIYWESKNYLLR